MKVLIVESDPNRGRIWRSHIRRLGGSVILESDQNHAIMALRDTAFDILVLNLDLEDEGSISVADYASYRWPDCKVIFVTARSFFSDGSIFSYVSNVCAFVPAAVAPEDMAALVEHHAR